MLFRSLAPEARLEARHVDATLSLVAATHGSISTPMGCDVRVEYGLLFMRAHTVTRSGEPFWLRVPGDHALLDGSRLMARLADVPMGSDPVGMARSHGMEWEGLSVMLDAGACGIGRKSDARLWVDSATAGDVLCPLGMHGQSKKLSDLLNEARIPARDRANVPIVRTGPRGAIVWVAGIRADERARCTQSTRLLLELSLVRSD